MSITKHVRGRSKFLFYREGNLYYETDTGLTFAIPLSDADKATFLAEDKSLFFMRWIRKHIETIKETHTDRLATL